MSHFHGVWVPLVTPFRNQAIDFPALKALAKRTADAGVAGLVACGSTGEAAALDDDEQLAVLDAILEAAPDCPVVVGLSGAWPPAMLAQLRRIQARPVAGLLVPPPSYIRPSQAGIVEFFHCLADASELPIILYNIPYRTGVNMTLDTIRRLAGHEKIVAIKDCGGDPMLTMQLIRDGRLAVLSGEDHQMFSTLCLGGAGAIAASAHLRPDLFVRVAAWLQSGRLHEAKFLFMELLPMIQLLFAEPNPAGVKCALSAQGCISNELRSPMQRASAELQDKLCRELQRIDDIQGKQEPHAHIIASRPGR